MSELVIPTSRRKTGKKSKRKDMRPARARYWAIGANGKSPIYPDMKLYEEILLLDYHFKGKYVVENVIQMRLADREGKLDLVSTPNGKNWFYRRARDIIDGKRDGYFQSGDSRENCYISQGFLEDRLRYFSLSVSAISTFVAPPFGGSRACSGDAWARRG